MSTHLQSAFDSIAGVRAVHARSILRAETPSNRTAASGATAMAQEPVRRAAIYCRAAG